MNNTKNRKNVRNAGNANSTRTFVISDPDAKATDNQRRAIAHAVKNGSLPRFAEEEWKNLTKGRASEIIEELRGMMHDCGAEDALLRQTESFTEKAAGALALLPRNKYTDLLESLLDYLLARTV